jgi:hypothetical protein
MKGDMVKLVMVEWLDSGFLHGWEYEDAQIHKCVSVAILVQETESEVIIRQSLSQEGCHAGSFAIPKVCITRMRQLKVK